jgi:2-polyprenyl-6-methoxyphenol hydroxylase-like FAD-dependent oxidoreductase
VTLYWSIRADAVEAFRAGSLQDFRATVCRYDPRAAAVLDQLGGTDELLVATYRDVSMKRHHGDGIVVIGDAAHAMSPQLGQGSNIALIDAATLADCLAVDRPVAASLSAYAARRRAHLAYYQWATRFLTPFFQSDGRGLGWLRDAFMPWAARVPWVRARMCGSMAGNLRGILGRPMSMPELTGADEPAPTRALEAGD